MPYRLALALAATLAAEIVVLRPTPQSVVPPGPLSIVAKGEGDVLLDGKVVAAQKPSPGVIHAKVEVTPGKHVLTVGAAKIQFAAGQGPDGWKAFRAHPPAAECAACHARESWEFKGAEACLACHDGMAFAKTHTHNTEVLNECQLCHSPHGSTENRHLKFTREIACKQCHG
jgi:predicted CXXCH cytochrome family protein